MRNARVHVLIAAAAGCSGSTNAEWPNIAFPPLVVVTAGSTTMFELSLEATPTSQVKGFLAPEDQSIATVTPTEFEMSPTNYPAVMTLHGTGHGSTRFDGRMADDSAGFSGGGVIVVDPASLTVLATNWNVIMGTSSNATFGIRLTQPPPSATTIAVVAGANSTSTSLVALDPESLIFDASNYDVVQTVAVTSNAEVGWTFVDLRPTNGIPAQTVVVNVSQ